MQTYFSDLLARERIAEFRREAHQDRLAALVRESAQDNRHRGRARRRVLVGRHARRAAA
jgi:hypothetical protein